MRSYAIPVFAVSRLLKDLDDGFDSTHSMFSNTIGKIAKLGENLFGTQRKFKFN
jgi:hypothetical protein